METDRRPVSVENILQRDRQTDGQTDGQDYGYSRLVELMRGKKFNKNIKLTKVPNRL